MFKKLNKNKIAKKLTILRKKHNLSQKKLAQELNLSPNTINKWENGQSFPTIENAYKLAKFYNIPLTKLFKEIL